MKILLTGGGTAGHVVPNLALINELKKNNFNIEYIGSKNGIEKQLVGDKNIKYYGISSGKLRRYFSVENLKDPIKILKGISEAYKIIKKEKYNVVFSKGGFVTVPVVIGAYLNKIPVIIHESDITPGLANKICMKMAKTTCTTFHKTLNYIDSEKGIYTGTPVRSELLSGDIQRGNNFLKFNNDKPVLLFIGGSLGSKFLNDAIRKNLNLLIESYNIVHICGKNNLDDTIINNGYRQYEYINNELGDVLACASIVISRAGSNAIHEFLALKKPNILIPLSKKASRGDQILNANEFKGKGYSDVILEENFSDDILISKINEVYSNKNYYINNMSKSIQQNSIDLIISEIKSTVK